MILLLAAVSGGIPGQSYSAPAQMDKPTASQVTASGATLTLASPPPDGGSPITRYDLRWSSNGGSSWTTQSGVAPVTPVTGLSAATAYLFQSRAINGIGPGGWSISESLTTLAFATVKSIVTGLRDKSTWNGRRGTNSIKTIGTDTLPAGISVSATAVTVNTYTGDLQDWDFSDRSLVVKSQMGAIRDCKLQQNSNNGILYLIDQYNGSIIQNIEYCDFIGTFGNGGVGTAINSRSSGSGAAVTVGQIQRVGFCRFTGLPSDCFKFNGAIGGQTVEYCYFGPPVNLPRAFTVWDAGVTYATLDLVVNTQGLIYESKVDGNIGNTPPPGANSSDAFWVNLNPHSDALTSVMAIGSVDIYRCLFDWTNDPIGPDGPYNVSGINNALRFSRNTGTSYPINRITARECVSYHQQMAAPITASLPIQVANNGLGNWVGPIEFIDSWVMPNRSGLYFHPSTNGQVQRWVNMRDAITDTIIAPPTGAATV